MNQLHTTKGGILIEHREPHDPSGHEKPASAAKPSPVTTHKR
jgi:hypothetical protein